MNQLIKGSVSKLQIGALLIFGVAILVGCGSKSDEPPVEAAPALSEKVQSILEPSTNLVTGDTKPVYDSKPATSPAMPQYNSSVPGSAPSSQVIEETEGAPTSSGSTEAQLEPAPSESDRSELFVAHDAIDALGESLFLEIISPNEEVAFVESSTFVLTARTTIDAAVSVNDTLVDVNEDGILETELTLEEGPNVVEVVTSISSGEEQSAVLTIFYLP